MREIIRKILDSIPWGKDVPDPPIEMTLTDAADIIERGLTPGKGKDEFEEFMESDFTDPRIQRARNDLVPVLADYLARRYSEPARAEMESRVRHIANTLRGLD